MQINDNIKLIRELSGKTQVEFAELIKTNVSNLKTYENTNVKPKAYLILNISKCAGISADDLENRKLNPEDIKFNDEKVDEYKKPSPTPYAVYERIIEEKEARRRDAEAWAQKMEAHYNDMKAALERAQITINEVLKPIQAQTYEILVNSKKAQEGLLSLKAETVAEHGEIMETLDQIAGQEPGTTASKAGIVELAHQAQKNQKGKKTNLGKNS